MTNDYRRGPDGNRGSGRPSSQGRSGYQGTGRPSYNAGPSYGNDPASRLRGSGGPRVRNAGARKGSSEWVTGTSLPRRDVVLGFIGVGLAAGVFRLADYQIVNAGKLRERADARRLLAQTLYAKRGTIYDRNGNVLVSNRASYNLVIINFVFFNAPDPNGNLLKVLNLCDELGIAYESHFPVSAERPYTYTDTDDTAWQGYFRSFLASRSYDLDISAPTLMKRLRDEYKIPDDWTQQDVYRVISVRYELELRSVDEIGMENYMLAEDVDAESLAAVMELAVPGVVVENGTVREYNTTYAAQDEGFSLRPGIERTAFRERGKLFSRVQIDGLHTAGCRGCRENGQAKRQHQQHRTHADPKRSVIHARHPPFPSAPAARPRFPALPCRRAG